MNEKVSVHLQSNETVERGREGHRHSLATLRAESEQDISLYFHKEP